MAIDVSIVDAAVLSAIKNADDVILYTPFGGSQSLLEDAFFQDQDEQPASGELEFLINAPTVMVHTDDATNPSLQDLFTINGQDYQARDFEADEGSMVFFELEEI